MQIHLTNNIGKRTNDDGIFDAIRVLSGFQPTLQSDGSAIFVADEQSLKAMQLIWETANPFNVGNLQ